MRNLYYLIAVFCAQTLASQTLIHHTTNYFGPNANPVPEFTDALIPQNTTVTALVIIISDMAIKLYPII